MYGEQDGFTVSEPLNIARRTGRWNQIDCKDSVHQMAYVGNTAWAFVAAEKAMLKDKQNQIGGKAFFVTDDTPIRDLFDLQAPFAKACGFSTDTFKVPVWPVLISVYILYILMWLISFVININMRIGISSLKFMRRTFTFKCDRAKTLLDYKPLYSYDESMKRSIEFYSKNFHR